jgi:hypothetical protein
MFLFDKQQIDNISSINDNQFLFADGPEPRRPSPCSCESQSGPGPRGGTPVGCLKNDSPCVPCYDCEPGLFGRFLKLFALSMIMHQHCTEDDGKGLFL